MTDLASPSLFITFEGIDGAGKSSHLASVCEHFKRQGFDVLLTREPGGTPLAEALRELVLRDAMDAMTEALLVFAARRDHIEQVIRPALARGAVVLCDRFTDSTFAYQGFGRQFSLPVLEQLEEWVQQGLRPGLTIWFDVDPAVAAARLAGARAPDRFESEQVTFFERVRAGYAARAARDPGRFSRIDGQGSRDEIWTRVEAVLAGLAPR